MRGCTGPQPPGALLRALVLYDIIYPHHRSRFFAAAVIASFRSHMGRSFCIVAAIMCILLGQVGRPQGLRHRSFSTVVCSRVSGYVGLSIAMRALGTSILVRLSLDKRASGSTGSRGEVLLHGVPAPTQRW